MVSHDTQYCMENPEQAFVDYASSRTDEARGLVSEFMASQDARLSKFEADFKQHQSEMTNKINTVLKAITDRIAGTLPSDTVKNSKLGAIPVLSTGQEEKGNIGNINSNPRSQPNPLASIAMEQVRKLNLMLESLELVPQSSNMKFVCSKENDREVMFIEIIQYDDEPQNRSLNEGEEATIEGPTIKYLDTFPTRDEPTYHKYFSFGGHLEELHVTWAHLEKKRTRLRTYTNISQDYFLSSWSWRHNFYVTPSQHIPRRRHKNPGRRQRSQPSPLPRTISFTTASRLKCDAIASIFL
uniref:Ribonuclease H-like domain-containing protein n=1 Tax=Tanacetum cinerariifolium TaxID=118510 RepID=A0A6L2J9R9_TANCI|nr:ribonuclease H-like domain-containing protein [Tanacetum cinerariifolium]